MTEVLVLAELTDGRLDPITHELLAAGRSLGSAVTAAVMGVRPETPSPMTLSPTEPTGCTWCETPCWTIRPSKPS